MGNFRKQIKIQVKDKIATQIGDEYLVCGNNDYDVIFEFDEAWNDYPVKTALFVFGNDSIEQPFNGDSCEGVAIEGATKCFIGVFSGDMVTTTKAEIKCHPSIRDIAQKPHPPKEDVYNKIIELINSLPSSGGGGGTPSNDLPLMDGEASAGVSKKFARGDHVHPTDTSRASAEELAILQNYAKDTRQIADDCERQLKFLPQADYDENDPTSKAYIKNRPFFRGFTEHTPDDDTVVDFGGALLRKCYDTPISKDKIIGAKYKLNYSVGGNEGSIEHTITTTDWQFSSEAGFITDPSAWILINEEGLLPEGFTLPAVIVVYDYEALNADSGAAFTSNGVYLAQFNEEGMSIEVEWVATYYNHPINNAFVNLKNHTDFVELKREVITTTSIAKGANQSLAFIDYASMVSAIKKEPMDKFNIGQNIMIRTLAVPDLWVFGKNNFIDYTFTSNEDFVSQLKENGRVAVGYYTLAQLETDKADLTNVPTYDDLEGYVKQVEYSKTNTFPDGNDGTFSGQVYARDYKNKESTIPVAIQSIVKTIPIRDHNGSFYVSEPSQVYHPATKGYVDNLPDKLTLDDTKRAKWQAWLGVTKLYEHRIYIETYPDYTLESGISFKADIVLYSTSDTVISNEVRERFGSVNLKRVRYNNAYIIPIDWAMDDSYNVNIFYENGGTLTPIQIPEGQYNITDTVTEV